MRERRRLRAATAWLTLGGVLAAAGACTPKDADLTNPPGSTVVPPVGTRAPVVADLADIAPELERTVADTVAELGVPGAAVLVVRGGQRWSDTVGVTELGADGSAVTEGPDGTAVTEGPDGTAVTQGLSWPLRSITKSFTVTLVLQLVDEGVVDLDDVIGNWVQGVPAGDRVTIRQLADMTSGLPEYTNEAFIADFSADPERVFTVDELLAYAASDPMQFEPGAERVYTNTNTLLLGRVVEVATGQSFAEALRTRLSDPLDLTDTVYPTDPSQWSTDAVGYAPDADAGGELAPQPVNFSVFGPAGAMIGTIEDLARWGRVLADGSLLDPDTQSERVQGGALDEGPTYDRYALGIGEIDGWWGHTGEGFGFTALVMHDNATDTTVAIAMNASQLAEHPPTVLFTRLAPLLVGT